MAKKKQIDKRPRTIWSGYIRATDDGGFMVYGTGHYYQEDAKELIRWLEKYVEWADAKENK